MTVGKKGMVRMKQKLQEEEELITKIQWSILAEDNKPGRGHTITEMQTDRRNREE